MSGHGNLTRRKRQLGRKLRRMRERAGMTLAEAAARLDKTSSSLHRIEVGETLADVHLIRTMMDIYDQRDDSLLDLSREARKRGWWYTYFGPTKEPTYVEHEHDANLVRTFQVITIPGLLQTENYMRANYASSHKASGKANADKIVAVRQRRQERLSDETEPLHLHVVLDESALRRTVGGREVMREQLRHILEMARLPTVTLQVIPTNTGAHSAMNGAFTVLSFADPDEPEIQYVEYPGGSLQIDNPDRVKEVRLVFERLTAMALSPEESIRLIEEVLAELYGP